MRPTLPAALASVAVVLLTGCGEPPGRDPAEVGLPGQPSATASPTDPSPTRPGRPSLPAGSSSPDSFPEEIALACGGRPAGEDVLAVLRDEELLSADTDAEIDDGPYCSGTWQYTVVRVQQRDPLQVITRGEPDALTLVTAGTDVCTIEVELQAPPGIHGVAACVG